jgi:hypothetical protein
MHVSKIEILKTLSDNLANNFLTIIEYKLDTVRFVISILFNFHKFITVNNIV